MSNFPSTPFSHCNNNNNNSTGKHKFSVLFTSNDQWTEESIIESFKKLSNPASAVFEAAWRGNVDHLGKILGVNENVEKLKDNGPNGFRDEQMRTPLHLASICGHIHCVQLLIEKGAAVNSTDLHGITALSCGASCGNLDVVRALLQFEGVNVNEGYKESGKTALQLAVQAASVECARILLKAGARQNPPKMYSETALQIAASHGDSDCLQLLIDHGADVNLCKGTDKSTALHLSSEEGSSACVKILLKAGACHSLKDSRGQTALHVAATSDGDCVMELLKAGANPNAVDANGRTPLHCAVAQGSGAADCVRLLVKNGADVDAQDNFGYTPLHLCAVHESSEFASILLLHGSDVSIKTNAGTSALSLLVRKIPDVMRYMSERLNAAVTIRHDHDPAEPDCEIRLDFRAIVPNCEKRLGIRRSIGSNAYASGEWGREKEQYEKHNLHFMPRRESDFLTCLMEAGNKKILAHPLSEAFLTLKWRRVRKFFWASLLFQILLVALFTVYVMEVYVIKCPYHRGHYRKNGNQSMSQNPASASVNASSNCLSGFQWFRMKPPKKWNRTAFTLQSDQLCKDYYSPPPQYEDILCVPDRSLQFIWFILISFAIVMAVKEMLQLAQGPLSYLKSSENCGQWLLILSVIVSAGGTSEFHLQYWNYPAAACGICLAWGMMLLQVGRFPALGLYVQMLGKVAANFGLFILAYACLIIAFALAFCVLFPEHHSYSSVPLSILKVFTMMVGELDYENLVFHKERMDDPVLFFLTAYLLYGAFVVIVTIVLMNLLVGMAVNDIQGLQKGAKLNKLSRQTALISRLESCIFSKKLQKILPRRLGHILQNSALLVPSAYNYSFYFRPNDPRDNRLPKDIKEAALRLASSRHSFTKIKSVHLSSSRRKPSSKQNSVSTIPTKTKAYFSNAINLPHRQNFHSSSADSSFLLSSHPEIAIKKLENRLSRVQAQLEKTTNSLNTVLVALINLEGEQKGEKTESETTSNSANNQAMSSSVDLEDIIYPLSLFEICEK